MSINSYLTFNGNCREAMTFYQHCLGGELSFQTIADSTDGNKFPLRMRKNILQATLIKDGLLLIATDMVGDAGLIKGNAIAMMLNCTSEEELKRSFTKLSVGAKSAHPLQETFSGGIFGNLTDKFGNHWLLSYDDS
ncbi:VOC family protein [Pedobacter endophyticus]|nr:VOC family protein [Pedobacter endophyticus]